MQQQAQPGSSNGDKVGSSSSSSSSNGGNCDISQTAHDSANAMKIATEIPTKNLPSSATQSSSSQAFAAQAAAISEPDAESAAASAWGGLPGLPELSVFSPAFDASLALSGPVMTGMGHVCQLPLRLAPIIDEEEEEDEEKEGKAGRNEDSRWKKQNPTGPEREPAETGSDVKSGAKLTPANTGTEGEVVKDAALSTAPTPSAPAPTAIKKDVESLVLVPCLGPDYGVPAAAPEEVQEKEKVKEKEKQMEKQHHEEEPSIPAGYIEISTYPLKGMAGPWSLCLGAEMRLLGPGVLFCRLAQSVRMGGGTACASSSSSSDGDDEDEGPNARPRGVYWMVSLVALPAPRPPVPNIPPEPSLEQLSEQMRTLLQRQKLHQQLAQSQVYSQKYDVSLSCPSFFFSCFFLFLFFLFPVPFDTFRFTLTKWQFMSYLSIFSFNFISILIFYFDLFSCLCSVHCPYIFSRFNRSKRKCANSNSTRVRDFRSNTSKTCTC
jgi:hypothetical protein